MNPSISSTSPFPIYEIGANPFQEICRDLFDAEPDVASCSLYGVSGQPQAGIDLIAYQKQGTEIGVGQCKCYRVLTPSEIKAVSEEFFKYWDFWSNSKVKRFILFVACDLNTTQHQNQIIKERRRFAERGIKYEVWSSKEIRNKLRPHSAIVVRYFKNPEHWVRELCGIATPSPPSIIETDSQKSLIVSSIFAQNEKLAARLSSQTETQIEVMRTVWRKGQRGEAINWVKNLRGDTPIWLALDPNIQAKVLRFEASLILDEIDGVPQAKLLVDEARSLSPSDDQSRIRALIAYKENGPSAGIELLSGKEDIDSLNLLAALLLDSGQIPESGALLDRLNTNFPQHAETFRLRALLFVLTLEIERARLEIQKALEIAPEWQSIREAAGRIYYLSALSPAVFPKGFISWPEPIDWAFVKRDDESLARLREAETIFLKLAKDAENLKELQRFESWRLACFANDSDRQEEAIRYCREILRKNRTNHCVIIWALTRKFDVKLLPCEKALLKLINNQEAELPHILALVSICLSPGSRISKKAIKILEDTKSVFEKNGAHILWLFWIAQAFVRNGDPSKAVNLINEIEGRSELLYPMGMALKAISRSTGDWRPLLNHLEKSYKETNDSAFLLESCELMAYRHEWAYVADRAEQLIKELQTADALQLAAAATNNDKRFTLCLRLLDTYKELFRGQRLPNELRRIRTNCCQALGLIPQAIAEAEALVRDEPTTDHLIHLAYLYSQEGDLKSLAIIARRLLGQSDFDPENSLRLASLIQWEDQNLAIALWRLGVEKGIQDDSVGLALFLGYHLGLDAELRPLHNKMAQLVREGKGGIKKVSIEDMISIAKQRQQHAEQLIEIYCKGTAPVHFFSSQLNRPLVDFYHILLKRNETSPDPLKQDALLIRHGGRRLVQGFPKNVPNSRICMDITAILLSRHLEILSLVEKVLRPIGIPENVVPALLEMMERVSPPQPRRIEALKQIIKLVNTEALKVIECHLPSAYENNSLVQEVGEEWAALMEHAIANDGYLVDFFPVRKRDLSGRPAILPDNISAILVNCRSIVESLREDGPFSRSDFTSALENLGDQGSYVQEGVIPKQGTILVCHGNIPEVLSSANLLQIICERFKVRMEKREFEVVKAELEDNEKRHLLVDWLGELIDDINKCIGDGTYEILTKVPNKEKELDESHIDTPTSKCLFTLLSFKPRERDVIWSDDRFVNGYLRRENIPIIGINEILKTLVVKGSLGLNEYYEKINILRAANTRFIPPEKEEILYHLKEAEIKNGKLIETGSLKIIRRYIAACLYKGQILQRPPMPEGSPNEKGELDFVIDLFRTINDSIVEAWANPKDDETTCQARGEWLFNNIFLDYAGVFKALSITKSISEEQYLEAIGLAGLIINGVTSLLFRNTDDRSAHRRYFKWLSDRLLRKRYEANPSLIARIAENLKNVFTDLQLKMEKKGEPREARELLQVFYEALPNPIKEELKQDPAFMSAIGLKTILITEIGGLKFNAADFLPAVAEAINGRNAKISTIDSKIEISIYPPTNLDKKTFCFNDPVTGEKRESADDLYGILIESPNKRERVLRKNRAWFDCSNEDLEKAIAEIASTEEIQQRIERTLSWRNSSTSIYYQEILETLTTQQQFQFSKGLPPSADGMLRHFRFNVDNKPNLSFEKSLTIASQKLLSEEGLFETIKRLSGLPVHLPKNLINAIRELSAEEGHKLVKKLVRTVGSPLSKIHFIYILMELSQDRKIYQRLARRVTVSLLNANGLEDFNAFLAQLRWVNEEFGHWVDVQQWPVPLRIAMIWAHSQQLFTIFNSAGVSSIEIYNVFENRRDKLPFEMFKRNPEYWYDISHPRHVSREGFLLTGLVYAFGDKVQNINDEKLQDLITPVVTHSIDDKSMPAFSLIKDTLLAQNTLNSFLAMTRGEALFSFFGNESPKGFKRENLISLAEQAIVRLSTSIENPSDWAIIHAIIGDLPSPENLTERLSRVLHQTNYVSLFKKDPIYGGIAIQLASSQAININNEDLFAYLKNQLIGIAKLFGEKTSRDLGSNIKEEVLNEPRNIFIILLESALNLALTVQSKGSTEEEFGNIVISIVEAWRAAAYEYKPIIQRLCEELPLTDAKYLWPLLIRLRCD